MSLDITNTMNRHAAVSDNHWQYLASGLTLRSVLAAAARRLCRAIGISGGADAPGLAMGDYELHVVKTAHLGLCQVNTPARSLELAWQREAWYWCGVLALHEGLKGRIKSEALTLRQSLLYRKE
jgi:hypothetical protein